MNARERIEAIWLDTYRPQTATQLVASEQEWRFLEALLSVSDATIADLVKALEPFARVVDAYDYFVCEVMPDLQFPVPGTRALDPGFERSLDENDFRRARAALEKARQP